MSEVQQKDKVVGMSAYWIAVGTSVLFSAAITVGVAAYAFYKVDQQRPVSVDIQRLIVEEITATSKASLDDAARQARAQAFSKALEESLDGVSEGGRRLVVVGPAVLRGAEDKTDIVQGLVRMMLADNKR